MFQVFLSTACNPATSSIVLVYHRHHGLFCLKYPLSKSPNELRACRVDLQDSKRA